MNRWKLLLAAAVVGSVAMGVRAEDKKVTFFGQVEFLTYSDAFEKAEEHWDKVIALDTEGVDDFGGSISSDKKTEGGIGVRLGALLATPVKGVSVGGSLGFINGPSFEGNEVLDGDTYSDKIKSQVIRALVESKYSLPMGKNFQARLGLGLGLAQVEVEHDFVNGGNVQEHPDYSVSGGSTARYTKMTWEVGPAIAFVSEKVGVELAVTYSQIPSVKSDQFQEFKWNPIGVRLGVEF